MIQNIEEVKSRIEIPLKQVKTYEIKKGDTIWDIAMKHEIDTREIERLNPNINIDNIQIGQAINLTFPRSVLNVRIIKEHQYEEKIPYETTYEESSELYEDDVKVKIRGKEGKKEVISEIVYINGIEENRQIINEKILEEPKTEVFLKGTKERPETLAYGNFMPPSRGKLTSRFGPRWGRTHTGIDIGVPIGTPNKAADGGKVIFAGWKGSYGELVIIDHENGYQTYYGHNSVIKVKEGELVYRGQVIALSGATGRVTGPNLHFEVRKNGQPVDPLKFIKY
nr:M23 family metallopeptidase [Sporosalibacterium faouarense]